MFSIQSIIIFTIAFIFDSILGAPPRLVTMEFIVSGDYTLWADPTHYKSFLLPFHIVLAHDLHQTYLPKRGTFGANDYNRHLQDFERYNDKDKQLRIKQSQRYIITNFITHSLKRMGIHGDVLRNWQENISNIDQLIQERYASVSSFVLLCFTLTVYECLFILCFDILAEWSRFCF